jgi:hypothetical protein
LTAHFWVLSKLTPVALDRSSGSGPIGKSSPKGCSRLAWPPRTSQGTAGMEREHNWRLEERSRAKLMNTEKY